jgi:hypothetical protein
MKIFRNEETRVIRNLDITSYFGYDVNVTEILAEWPHEYLLRYPRDDVPPLDILLETLTSEFLTDEGMLKRFLKNITIEHEKERVSAECYKREDGAGGREVTYTSKAFGIKIRGEKLGNTDWCFSISPLGNNTSDVHEAAEKALRKHPDIWQRRISEIKIDLRVASTRRYQDRDTPVYEFSPEKIAREVLRFTPKEKVVAVRGGLIHESFTSSDNDGVQVCIMRGLPVYLRFMPEHNATALQRDSTEKRRSIAFGPGEHLLLRDSAARAEFFVKSVGPSYFGDECPADVDYCKELALMQQVAQELYVGIWLWRQQGVQRS